MSLASRKRTFQIQLPCTVSVIQTPAIYAQQFAHEIVMSLPCSILNTTVDYRKLLESGMLADLETAL